MTKSTKPAKSEDVVASVRKLGNPRFARVQEKFFRTQPGGYGQGDRFLGINVPTSRSVARQFADLPLAQVQRLLRSQWHEPRLVALFILVRRFERGDAKTRADVYRVYMNNLSRVNNWDLVDASAHKIVGPSVDERGELATLYRLVHSDRWYERRIAVVASHHFIATGRFEPTLMLAERLLGDDHDLLHKAVGWMLREVGKRDLRVLRNFLDARAGVMPRTMLRYAIEKLPPQERLKYMDAKMKRRRSSEPRSTRNRTDGINQIGNRH